MKEVGVSSVSIYNGFHMGKTRRKTENQPQEVGTEERFLKAFDEYADMLFRHASFRIADRDRAIDLVHDSYTKVWTYIRRGHEIDAFKPFLYKVLNNLIIDEYRKKREASLDQILEAEGMDEGSFEELHDGSIEEITFSLDAKKAATHIVDLSPRYCEVLTLRFIDGLGPKEISELVEVSENVISVRIHRGLKLLREIIEQAEEDAENKRLEKNI